MTIMEVSEQGVASAGPDYKACPLPSSLCTHPQRNHSRYRSRLLHQERVLVRAMLPALSHRGRAGLGSWVPGGWGSGGRSVGAMSLATEAPCEQAQRPIESPPTLAPGLSPAA